MNVVRAKLIEAQHAAQRAADEITQAVAAYDQGSRALWYGSSEVWTLNLAQRYLAEASMLQEEENDRKEAEPMDN